MQQCRVDAPLARPSELRNADRPPFARLSRENDARRAERLPSMLQVRPRFSLRPARSPLADAKPKGPQQAGGERVGGKTVSSRPRRAKCAGKNSGAFRCRSNVLDASAGMDAIRPVTVGLVAECHPAIRALNAR